MFVWFKRLVSWGVPNGNAWASVAEDFRQLHITTAKDVLRLSSERLCDRDYLTQLLIISRLGALLKVVERRYPNCVVEQVSPAYMAITLAGQSLKASWEHIDFIVQQLSDVCGDDDRLWLVMRGMCAPAFMLKVLAEEELKHEARKSSPLSE